MSTSNLYFSTYTNLNWIPILEKNEYKDIVIDSLKFLVNNNRVVLYAFVIMPNHIHLLWKINEGLELRNVQRDFLKYTAQKIKLKMIDLDGQVNSDLLVNAKDRKVQIWERNGFSFKLLKHNTIMQKLFYIHNNPMNKKWNLCDSLEKYKYSSYNFYLSGKYEFGFLTDIHEFEGA